MPERLDKLVEALPFCRIDGTGKVVASTAASVDGPFDSVLRSKGFVWRTDEPQVAVYWSQAGKQLELSQMGRWWAAVERWARAARTSHSRHGPARAPR